MITNFNAPIISDYSPISARGGKRTRRRNKSRRNKTRRSRARRTRRNYH